MRRSLLKLMEHIFVSVARYGCNSVGSTVNMKSHKSLDLDDGCFTQMSIGVNVLSLWPLPPILPESAKRDSCSPDPLYLIE